MSKTEKIVIDAVNGVKFTPREIDVISCVISGRNAKSTAVLLGLSTKTVANHIYNIRQKFEWGSRDEIARRAEKGAQYGLLRRHYSALSGKKIPKDILESPKDEANWKIVNLLSVSETDAIIEFGRERNKSVAVCAEIRVCFR